MRSSTTQTQQQSVDPPGHAAGRMSLITTPAPSDENLDDRMEIGGSIININNVDAATNAVEEDKGTHRSSNNNNNNDKNGSRPTSTPTIQQNNEVTASTTDSSNSIKLAEEEVEVVCCTTTTTTTTNGNSNVDPEEGGNRNCSHEQDDDQFDEIRVVNSYCSTNSQQQQLLQQRRYRKKTSGTTNNSNSFNNNTTTRSSGLSSFRTSTAEELEIEDNEVSSPFAVRKGRCLVFSQVCLSVTNNANNAAATRRKRGLCRRRRAASGEAEAGRNNNNNNNNISSSNNKKKIILDNVWGNVPAGQITAIMGTSGSGKTSLLNVLSGRIASKNSSKMEVNASNIYLNEKPVDPSHIAVRQMIAFVAQEDSLPITATPREALYFSARLRRPRSTTNQELRILVDRMIRELHLESCADTLIGGTLVSGVSGGERKRTSVGVELVTHPSLVFLDEPTSGLDSFNAAELCQVLKRVALAGSAVLMTIHQPSSEIFAALDGLLLLKMGRVLYGGRGREDICDYFQSRGFPCPSHYNPADYVLHISQTHTPEQLELAGFFPTDDPDNIDNNSIGNNPHQQQEHLASNRISSVASRKKLRNSTHSLLRASSEPTLGFCKQTGMLFWRELQNLKRNKKALFARSGMTLLVSSLNGIIFFQIGKTDYRDYVNAQSTFGAILMSLLANVFSTALPTLVSFPEERPVFLREYSTNHYSVTAYFTARLATELTVTGGQVVVSTCLTYFLMGFSLPFGTFWSVCYTLAMTSTALGVLIGCSVKDPGVAVEFLPMVFMPQILFSGFFIPPELIPVWLRWLNWVFPLVYAVKITVVGQFYTAGLCDDHDLSVVPINNCKRILDHVDADPDDTWWYWLVLVGQFLFFRSVALIMLRSKATRFY